MTEYPNRYIVSNSVYKYGLVIPVSNMDGTSLNLYSEIIDSINNDWTEDQDSTKDDADYDYIGQVCSLSRS